MTDEDRTEKSFNLVADSFLSEMTREINKPHPTIKAKDLDMEKIRHDIFNTVNPATEKLNAFKKQRAELEQSINEQRMERMKKWQEMAVPGEVPVPPELVEAMKKVSAQILECCRFIADNILHAFGLVGSVSPYRPMLTDDQIRELEIDYEQNELMQVINSDGSLRDNLETAIVMCNERRKNELSEWENRPEALDARDCVRKFKAIMSSDKSDSFKKKVSTIDRNQLKDMLDKIDVAPDGNIIQKQKSSKDMTM
ncbi:hypothetical protein AA0312_0931 [Acetobacter tropicalis NRIC 0312]|nr:hypothetical protein [Acetobacter tropicalis]GBR68475.1 hypothetical protein AA0312_0931 [Acetobacter tropicalis NRIC 0312]